MPAHARWRCVFVAAAWSAAPSRPSSRSRAAIDLVRLPVVVTGKDGLSVARHSTAEDFEVTRGRRDRRRVAFLPRARQVRVAAASRPPARRAARAWSRICGAAANAAVQFVTRSTKPWTSRSSTSTSTIRSAGFSRDSYPRLFERIRERKADGGTVALRRDWRLSRSARSTRDRPACAALYTDGGDTTSPHELRQAAAKCCDSATCSSTRRLSATTRAVERAHDAAESRLIDARARDGRRGVLPAATRDLQTAYARDPG